MMSLTVHEMSLQFSQLSPFFFLKAAQLMIELKMVMIYFLQILKELFIHFILFYCLFFLRCSSRCLSGALCFEDL